MTQAHLCAYCGNPLESDDQFICKACFEKTQESPEMNSPVKKEGLSIECIIIISFFVIMSIIGCFVVYNRSPALRINEPQIVDSSDILSERQQKILTVFQTTIKNDIEDTIKSHLKFSFSAVITHDLEKLDADGAIFYAYGNVMYKNFELKNKSDQFEVEIIATDSAYYAIYVKIGDNVLTDSRSGTTDLGIATKYGKQYFNTDEGKSIFSDKDGSLIVIPDEKK